MIERKNFLRGFIMTIISFAFSINLYAQNVDYDCSYWEPVCNAIIQVESGGNPKARNGIHVGAMQISPGMVRCCNDILKKNNETRRFTLNDRLNIEKSKQMFAIFQWKYNKGKNIEIAIRMWNGGPGYKVSTTQRYLAKVLKELNEINENQT
jgi:soluble lytic murein transglycosylase-like protein